MPSQKVLAAKEKIVQELSEEFSQAQAIVFADYRGLTVDQDTEMRAALRKADVKYKVIKNSMSELAMKKAGIEGLEEVFKGPTAIAFSNDDVIMPAKIVKEFVNKFDNMEIKGGILEGKVISLEEINRLAAIPTLDVLYGQLVFGLMSPIAKLAILLNAIKEKAEESGVEVAEEDVSVSDSASDS